MKPLNVCYRLFIYLSMALTICHPPLKLAATTFSSIPDTHQPSILIGKLENGLNYTLLPSSTLKNGVWIKLACAVPSDDENESVSLLTQHALFYGTEKQTRQDLATTLDHLGLDVEPDSYVKADETEKSLQFYLSDCDPETVRELLEMLNQIVFFPSLERENIEWARRHLLSTDEQSEEENLALQSVTASEIKTWHAQWYCPEHMHLTIVGLHNPEEMLPILSEVFESAVLFSQNLPQESPEEQTISSLMDRVEWTQDNQSLVVDGKIWMNQPNWINKSNNGRMLGVVLTILGIGGAILAFPIVAPLAIFAGSLTTATGIYFLASPYLKDPHYIESVRQIDLQKGCAFAYKNSRAGLTLTPYERRALFLQEMVDRPQILPKLPILLLADLYQLNDPCIAEIFTVDEFNALTRLKRDFIHQRNQYKWLKESLEKELAALTAPYALVRDAALIYAKEVYNQNYYVVSKQTMKDNRDKNIAEIKRAFSDNKISIEERDSLIQQARDYYEGCVSYPDFKTGLDAAEMTLSQMELEIQATYQYQVELCKQSMQYHQRMNYYNLGENSLRHFFDQELNSLLATFPVYFTVLPDFLDLRSL